ncbi:MAG TPA: TraR/DksA C4-type zinc finger protein [Verrucomicrobiae bacterium]|nr:TraR/DksA C4-type zinc finger protein [Verrucomicrobiae bacterium]
MKKQARKIKADKPKAIAKKGTMGTISKAKAAPKEKVSKAEAKKRAAEAALAAEENRPAKTLKLSKDDATKFKKLLLDLRDHLIDGVNFLASDNLKRTQREASGELSGYSLHMADAGSDNFDREFALSLVSNEQEALYEIEEALKRLEHSTYGVCGNCEKNIMKARLEAVPFARLCVNCQSDIEKDHRRPAPQGPMFTEGADEDGGEAEESEE